MKDESTYAKALEKVDAKIKRMKEQAEAVRWFYENNNMEYFNAVREPYFSACR